MAKSNWFYMRKGKTLSDSSCADTELIISLYKDQKSRSFSELGSGSRVLNSFHVIFLRDCWAEVIHMKSK